ncbi:MAG: Sun protein [Deltaproteobacteria bacterium]|nr:Sun protein [Deltaproteobacteria bacterium]
MSPRDRAVEVLLRVERDGAFAAAVLDAALERPPALAPRDRALATELVYGVLRALPALDEALGRHARDGARSLAALDPLARASLRVGAWQLLALDRVPPSAAVNAAVALVRRKRSAGLGGFVNAVLRKLASERPEALPEDARLALFLRGVPGEVRASLAEELGADGADAFLRAALGRAPAVSLRANTLRGPRGALLERLRAELPGCVAREGGLTPWALSVSSAGDPSRCGAYGEGLFSVQDEGAQAAALATEARPGQRVLDVCAGRGGKTAALATMLRGEGLLHAVDLHPQKLDRLREECARALGREGFAGAFAADLTRGLGGLAAAAPRGGYDVVLVDAPCSGYGTVARRPDLSLRLRDAAGRRALLETQRAVAQRAAGLVAPGGTYLYAVCTVSREEGDGALEAVRAAHPSLQPAEGSEALPPRLRPWRVVLTPDQDGTDGFMLFRLRRSAG